MTKCKYIRVFQKLQCLSLLVFKKKILFKCLLNYKSAYCYLYDNISQNTKYLLVLICSCMSTCIKYHARIELKFHILMTFILNLCWKTYLEIAYVVYIFHKLRIQI